MNVVLTFEGTNDVLIHSVSVIGSFNDFDASKGEMTKEGGDWVYRANLGPGEHRYKFLVNNELPLHDAYANIYEPDENEELWSLLIINEQGQRLFNNHQYTVHVEDYSISNKMSESPEFESKKTFSMDTDKQIVARFQFSQITGLHPMTIVWYTPQGEIFQVSENAIFAENEQESVQLWFWMDMNEIDKQSGIGTWTMKAFIDGEYILEDHFTISRMGLYTANRQFINI